MLTAAKLAFKAEIERSLREEALRLASKAAAEVIDRVRFSMTRSQNGGQYHFTVTIDSRDLETRP